MGPQDWDGVAPEGTRVEEYSQEKGEGIPGKVQGERSREEKTGGWGLPQGARGARAQPGPVPSLTGRSTLTSVPSSRKTRQ